MQNTCSISIGVFKEKYCSYCSFMEAQSHQNRIIHVEKYFKGNISYLLRYMMEIVSGESLSKWRDKWLPIPMMYRVLVEAKVSEID